MCICVQLYAALHFQNDEDDGVDRWLKHHMVTLIERRGVVGGCGRPNNEWTST